MKNKKKGFTLVELIVVLAILAILAAMLVPALTGYIDKAREKKELAVARQYYIAAQAVASETYADSVPVLSLSKIYGNYIIAVSNGTQSGAGNAPESTKTLEPDSKYVKTFKSYIDELEDKFFYFEISGTLTGQLSLHLLIA